MPHNGKFFVLFHHPSINEPINHFIMSLEDMSCCGVFKSLQAMFYSFQLHFKMLPFGNFAAGGAVNDILCHLHHHFRIPNYMDP